MCTVWIELKMKLHKEGDGVILCNQTSFFFFFLYPNDKCDLINYINRNRTRTCEEEHPFSQLPQLFTLIDTQNHQLYIFNFQEKT